MADEKNQDEHLDRVYGTVDKKYEQASVSKRIEALFLDNVGKIITSQQIKEVATNPVTGQEPENWHQRLSELRTDSGYTILSSRDKNWLKVQEYVLLSTDKRVDAGKRKMPDLKTWKIILTNAEHKCEWSQDGLPCDLKQGEIDPIGGGTVKLTPDHKQPHSVNPNPDPNDPLQWQALCGRHQVMKKNYWDSSTGKMNVYAIMQSATAIEKEIVFRFLLDYFNYKLDENNNIKKDGTSE